MERLSARKKLVIVRQYLSGLSYDEIAAKSGVSKGTVANVVTDLKAGRFPEAADAYEQIELLRELSIDLKRSGLTPGQCTTGLTVLTRINECGLDPVDIDRLPLVVKSAGSEDEVREFLRAVYSIQQVQEKTGLSLEDLDNKVRDLERKAAELEPMSRQHDDCKKQLAELTRQREELSSTVTNLEEKHKLLTPRVKDLEKREQDLSRRITDMELKAQKAETTLSTLNGEMQRLQDIGLSFEELAEFNGRLQVAAKRHPIKPDGLRDRLLYELESLDKGLGLEALIRNRQQELDKTEQAITNTKKELETAKAVVGSLKQEKTNLESSIKETREQVGREIAKIMPVAQDTINKLAKELRRGFNEAVTEVHRLRDEAVEVGREVGRYEGILQVNEWLNELLALIRGEESVAAKRVRVIILSVLRGAAVWLKHYEADNVGFSTISFATNNLIRELEQWKV